MLGDYMIEHAVCPRFEAIVDDIQDSDDFSCPCLKSKHGIPKAEWGQHSHVKTLAVTSRRN